MLSLHVRDSLAAASPGALTGVDVVRFACAARRRDLPPSGNLDLRGGCGCGPIPRRFARVRILVVGVAAARSENRVSGCPPRRGSWPGLRWRGGWRAAGGERRRTAACVGRRARARVTRWWLLHGRYALRRARRLALHARLALADAHTTRLSAHVRAAVARASEARRRGLPRAQLLDLTHLELFTASHPSGSAPASADIGARR